MAERDKLIAQAEALEWALSERALRPHLWREMAAERTTKLRALAAQQPEAVEPVAKVRHTVTAGYEHTDIEWLRHDLPADTLLYTRPQASVPADHTAAADQKSEAGNNSVLDAAVGVTPDLDALVAQFQELNMGNYTEDEVGNLNNWAIEAYQAITDLRAQLAHSVAENEARQDLCALRERQLIEQGAIITRLEDDNAEARELAANWRLSAEFWYREFRIAAYGEENRTYPVEGALDSWFKSRAFLAKQGD